MNINWHTFWSAVGTMFGVLVVLGGILYGYMEARVCGKVEIKLKDLEKDMEDKYVSRPVCKQMHQNSSGEMKEFKEDMKKAISDLGRKMDKMNDYFLRLGARALHSLEDKGEDI